MNKNAIVIGIRNEDSLCYYIAKQLKKQGYNIYATFRDGTKEDVERVAGEIGIKKLYQYDAGSDQDLEKFTEAVKADGIKLDILVHGIAYSSDPDAKLNHDLMNVSWDEFADAIRVGAFSLVEVVGKLIDQFNEKASILTLTSRLSRLAVPGFNVIGAAKASLDSIIRGLSEALGKLKEIRVNGIAPGPVPTKSLGKVGNVLNILETAKKKSPLNRNVKKEDVGRFAVTVLENQSLTGTIYPIDTGMDIMGN
jgi:enoyl-[acyl-carrier protein] reductase I